MRRLLVLLECDQCKNMLTATPFSNSRVETDLNHEAAELEYMAERNGWSVYRSQHVCPDCIMDNMAERHA